MNKEVFNKIRGLSSNPGAYFKIDNFTIKVYESELVSANTNLESSVICDVAKDSFSVSCLNGSVLRFKSIKPEGKGIMNVKDFLNGKGKNILIKGKKIN